MDDTTQSDYSTKLNHINESVQKKKLKSDKNSLEEAKIDLTSLLNASSGILEHIYKELTDLSMTILSQADTSAHVLLEPIANFFDTIKEKEVKGKTEIFQYICTSMLTVLEKNKVAKILDVKFVEVIVTKVLNKAISTSKEQASLLFQLTKALIQCPAQATVASAKEAVQELSDRWKWRQNLDSAKDLLATWEELMVNDQQYQNTIMEGYNRFIKAFLYQLSEAKLDQEVSDHKTRLVLSILDKNLPGLYPVASELSKGIVFGQKKKSEFVMKVFRLFDRILKEDGYPWTTNQHLTKASVAMIQQACHGMRNANLMWVKEDDFKVILSLFLTCVEKGPGKKSSLYFQITEHMLQDAIRKFEILSKAEWIQPLFGALATLSLHQNDELRHIVDFNLVAMIYKHGRMMAPYLETFVKAFFRYESTTMIMAIDAAYEDNPGPVNEVFSKIMEFVGGGGDSFVHTYVIQLCSKAAKIHPEVFTEDHIELLTRDTNNGVREMMILEDIAKKQPYLVAKHLHKFLNDSIWGRNTEHGRFSVLKMIGVKCPEHTKVVLERLCKALYESEDHAMPMSLLDGIRNVGATNIELLKTQKGIIEKVHRKSNIQHVRDGCMGLIDIIEGRSLATLDEDLRDTKEEVKELDVRVTNTDKQVKVVTKEVKQQKREVKAVKKDVKTHGKKITTLEKNMDETAAKVEEIDNKTLSHAPFWAPDVSKLLNPKAEHDWRLLSSRLGYSNDDIRGWAQQHDPCMAMLNEWYAVRKTSEATFAVLTALQEMDRMDAAIIVENAMKMADTVVEDEEFEYPEPPEVFISYQWGMQNEVKLLKQHLEKAGYSCWMDIGQMGGGDKLFEKIDQGIRASKVIISCVTEKYAKSPNCNREVNLSVSLGKPLIPLLMEKQSWPPSGSMGPIFSEYLFIRFFTRPGELSGTDRYWSPAKFQELLMQLNYNGIVPDESKVDQVYKDWWIPVTEEIQIDAKKDTNKSPHDEKSVTTEIDIPTPDVFISYQWGKQKQIMLLYRRLVNLGFTCWMDIYQMGGGDSLYDKIDRGVRGCKIVLSCVTTKYSLSANCRREVSLADALKKPIVPLLLEKITWPPTGPMSMVFTQLLYINFSKNDKVQETWTGKEFEELLGKVQNYIPEVITSKELKVGEQNDICEQADVLESVKQPKESDVSRQKRGTNSAIKYRETDLLHSKEQDLTEQQLRRQTVEQVPRTTPESFTKKENQYDKQPGTENVTALSPKFEDKIKEKQVERVVSEPGKPTNQSSQIDHHSGPKQNSVMSDEHEAQRHISRTDRAYEKNLSGNISVNTQPQFDNAKEGKPINHGTGSVRHREPTEEPMRNVSPQTQKSKSCVLL